MAPSTTATLDNTLGVAFLGVVGASILSGSTFVQTYIYYHHYPEDSVLNKWAVGILCSLDTLHLTIVVHAVYFYSVVEYGNILALQTISWSLKLQALISVVIILLVHILYTYRVCMIGGYHKGVLGYLVAFVVAAGGAMGFVLATVVWKSRTLTELEKSTWLISATFGFSTSIDFAIAVTMCYYLCKSRGSFTGLNSKISKVIQYTISSGLLTSASSLANLFSYILMPQTYIGVSLTFLTTKLYVGSFLAMLNSRERTNSQVFNPIPASWRRLSTIVIDPSGFEPKTTISGEVSGVA